METTNIELSIGETYKVFSNRKGKFRMMVTEISDDFVTGIIISGKAKAIMQYNERLTGEEVTVRKSLTSFSN